MALPITQVDYSPLYNAYGAKRNAGLLAAQGAANNAELVSGLTQMITDSAKAVYGILKEGATEKAKAKTIELETEYSKRIVQGIYTGEIHFDESGNLIEPKELQDWYSGQQAEIEKGLEAFPEVKGWASGQMAEVRQRGTLHALDVASAAAKADRDAAARTTLGQALDMSVAQGSMAPFHAALQGMPWMQPQQKATVRQQGEQDFAYRLKQGDVKDLVSAEGYDVGAAAVEGWRKSGDVTGEQADNLLQTAEGQRKVQALAYAQQAQKSYQEYIGAGVDPEMAIRISIKRVPQAYNPGTEELLRAAKETMENRADSAADEKMQDFYKDHRDDPSALRGFLDLPANKFSAEMKRPTFMYWDAVVQARLRGGGAGGGGDHPMGPGERAAWSVFYDAQKTNTMVGTEIKDLVVSGQLGADVAPEILAKMSQRQTFINPVVLAGVNVINATFDIMADKEKDPLKSAQIRMAQRDGLMNLDRYLGEGPHNDAQVSGAVAAFLRPYKADILKSDWWNPDTRSDVDIIRSDVWQGRYMPQDQRVAFERYDRDMLASAYGVGKKPGTMIRSSEELDNGMYRFYVVGLNPAQKDRGFWYTFQTDRAAGTEQLMVLERRFNAKGEHIGDAWMPATFVKPVAQEQKEAREAAKAAAEAAQKRSELVIESAVKAAAGEGPLDIAAVQKIASERRIPVREVAEQAARHAAGATAMQLQQVEDYLYGKRKLAIAQIKQAARDLGVSEAQLYLAALDRGMEIVK